MARCKLQCALLLICVTLSVTRADGVAIRAELAGEALTGHPFFQFVRSFGPQDAVQVAVDPDRHPELTGSTCDLWIVAERSEAAWDVSFDLLDVRPTGAQAIVLDGPTIRENTFVVAAAGVLSGDAGPGLGVGYDVVLDCDRDGLLSTGDLIDGRGDEAGFYVVDDTTVTGPLTVLLINHDGGYWATQRIYYPAEIGTMGRLPLVVVSHGWTHEYTWYGHIGLHLASHGYVVMAHRNNVGSGGAAATETASTTTLSNTDYFLGNLATIGGGVLEGHIDSHRIVWIGHSTGAEGVVRAHTRLRTGDYVPQHYGIDDIVLLCPIAPVSFHPGDVVTPHDANLHMFIGGADTDTSGAPLASYTQPISIYERGFGNRQLTYVQGAGHGDFHAADELPWAEGPDLIGRAETNRIVKGYYLPLVELYVKKNPAAEDFFTRMYDDFHPAGVAPEVIIATEYRDAAAQGNFVLDDYQSEYGTSTSSSGGGVSYDVSNLDEVLMQDLDGSFFWSGSQPSNGMTRARFAGDDPRCAVFDWEETPRFYELEIVPSHRDLSESEFLSFRACQGTRHPLTDGLDSALSFTVTLRDGAGGTGSLDFARYGGISRPYRRWGYGVGFGWQNEFSTVRIRLSDFQIGSSGLDLSDVVAVRFEFGPGFGSKKGRIGLDDVEIVEKRDPVRVSLALEQAGGDTRITWPAAVGALSFHVYRGTIPANGFPTRGSGPAAYDHLCFEAADLFGDGWLRSTDSDPVPAGAAGYYYLVTEVRAGGEEPPGRATVDLDPGTPGDQFQRPISDPCE